MAMAALPLAASLGWLFADRAVRPGWRAGLVAALGVDISALVLGAFLVAALSSFSANSEPGDLLASTIGLGLIGLVFLGIPMLVLAFFVAIVWVGLVRLSARLIHPEPAGAA
jgi:hypothetical protein